MPQRIFISDCEGPVSKNDNAFELSQHYIPNGDKFFSVVSKYDDILADVVKRFVYLNTRLFIALLCVLLYVDIIWVIA